MIQLKLKLNSKKPTTVYAANGKTYQLNPGSNVLNLEYEDYTSLAKALGIKPVDNKKPEVKKVPTEEPKKSELSVEEPKEESQIEETKEESPTEAQDTEVEESPVEEPKEEVIDKDNAIDSVNEKADYSAFSLKQLKTEYKKITGENCKLKKDEIISFLQEHSANA